MAINELGAGENIGSRLNLASAKIGSLSSSLRAAAVRPEISALLRPDRFRFPIPLPQVPPQPVPPAPLPVPAAPGENTFKELPFPSPGDRIKADDIKKISQSLRIIYDLSVLSGSLIGHMFGEVRLALLSQQYELRRVMTVFGTELDNASDTSLDNRKLIQIVPLEFGTRQVGVILSEAVETRRFAPALIGRTYKEASEHMKLLLGDVAVKGAQMPAPQFIGLTLEQSRQVSSR